MNQDLDSIVILSRPVLAPADQCYSLRGSIDPAGECVWDTTRYRPLHCVEEEEKAYCMHAGRCDYQVRVKGKHLCGYLEAD